MKKNLKMVITILVIISMVSMFLPIAYFNDNSASNMQSEIDKQADKVKSAQDQLERWIAGGKKSESEITKQREKV